MGGVIGRIALHAVRLTCRAARYLFWRCVPYAVRLFWPVLVGSAFIVLGVGAFREGLSGDMDRLLALCATAPAAVGLSGCILWAVLSIHAYRHTETPPPPL